MQTYRLTATITLHPDRLVGLAPAQVAARAHALRLEDPDAEIYRVTCATQFKAGEVLRLDGPDGLLEADALAPVEIATTAPAPRKVGKHGG